MTYIFFNTDFYTSLILIIALIFVLLYEVINGFHDTANAVATVIYTHAIKSNSAVLLAGIFNFFGVLLGGLSVAYTIVHLIPIDLVNNTESKGLVMIFAILCASIIWNLSTWYFGLPASSSHTLIGAIIGVCIINAILNKKFILDSLNFSKMIEIIASLLLSPIFGLIISGLLIFLMRKYLSIHEKYKIIHMSPNSHKKIKNKEKPPFWIRFFLIVSAIGVSYSHGANDGQKGIGLIMLVLVIIIPSNFIINMNSSVYDIQQTRNAVNYLNQYYNYNSINNKNLYKNQINNKKNFSLNESKLFFCNKNEIINIFKQAQSLLNNVVNFNDLNYLQRKKIHNLLICISDFVEKTITLKNLDKEEKLLLNNLKKDILNTIEYAPMWIIVAVALSLSLGTVIGWKRIAVTIGEKIGKKEMTYAQGLSAQTTSAISIGLASYIGMPVSTPYIMSSSLTGAILADGGEVQYKTIRSIMFAWLFTLPISMIMSGILFLFCIKVFN